MATLSAALDAPSTHPDNVRRMADISPTLEWLHICDYAFRDEAGKLCLIGMFDALHSRQLPGRLPVFCVAIGLTDGQGQYQAGLQIESPTGKMRDLDLPPVALQNPQAKARAVIRLANLPFEEFGRYTFRLKLDGVPIPTPAHVLDHLELQEGAMGGGPAPGTGPGLTPDYPVG